MTDANISSGGMAVAVVTKEISEDDPVCIKECQVVVGLLEKHLIADGYKIPEWIHGGCDEDWGYYFECMNEDELITFAIGFISIDSFPVDKIGIYIQYHVKDKTKKWYWPFSKTVVAQPDSRIHRTMKDFADNNNGIGVFTEGEFSEIY